MKWLTLFVLLLFSTVATAQEEQPPYLYYYSHALNAIVIERADGSDSQTLGEGLTSLEANEIGGPGWSPDGQWFAWYGIKLESFGNFLVRGAAAVRLDNQARLEILDQFASVDEMLWSPDSRYLLVRGRIAFDSPIRATSFWLIDMQTRTVATSTEMYVFAMTVTTPLEWRLNHQQIVFYVYEELVIPATTVRVTMQFDGTVVKERITQQEYDDAVTPVEAFQSLPNTPLDSPSGRYITDATLENLIDTQTDHIIPLPQRSDAAAPTPIDVRWHPSEAWALFGYQRCFTDCWSVGGVNVFHAADGTTRELSQCGFRPACVDWLPAQVDVTQNNTKPVN